MANEMNLNDLSKGRHDCGSSSNLKSTRMANFLNQGHHNIAYIDDSNSGYTSLPGTPNNENHFVCALNQNISTSCRSDENLNGNLSVSMSNSTDSIIYHVIEEKNDEINDHNKYVRNASTSSTVNISNVPKKPPIPTPRNGKDTVATLPKQPDIIIKGSDIEDDTPDMGSQPHEVSMDQTANIQPSASNELRSKVVFCLYIQLIIGLVLLIIGILLYGIFFV